MSDEEKVKELLDRINRLAKKEKEVDSRMKKLEKILEKKIKS